MSDQVRILSSNDLKLWQELVIDSPQASLFHTLEWNQMIHETDRESNPRYLIFDRKGAPLGGIPIILSKGKVDLPLMGYNGPIFSSSLNYDQRAKTAKAYEVCTQLINYLGELSSRVSIRNQPEIWDLRAFTFLNWNFKTMYTHIIHCNEHHTAGRKFSESLISKANEWECSITQSINSKHISDYCLKVISSMRIPFGVRKKQREVLERRIQSLLLMGLGKMILLTNNKGDELGMVFILLSKPNHAIYFCNTVYLLEEFKKEVIPLLASLIKQSFSGEFNFIDLGESELMETANEKDKMGAILTPLFIVSNPR